MEKVEGTAVDADMNMVDEDATERLLMAIAKNAQAKTREEHEQHVASGRALLRPHVALLVKNLQVLIQQRKEYRISSREHVKKGSAGGKGSGKGGGVVKNTRGKVVHSKANANAKDNGKIVLSTELELILCIAEVLEQEQQVDHDSAKDAGIAENAYQLIDLLLTALADGVANQKHKADLILLILKAVRKLGSM